VRWQAGVGPTAARIIELLLVTAVPAMLLAQRGVPSLGLVLVTLIGGALAAGSANTINCYLDRDIDAVMKRTSCRPLVSNGHGTIKPWEALPQAHWAIFYSYAHARVRAAGAAEDSRSAPMRLFHTSIAYLTLLFAAVAVTAVLSWGHF
jgi:heme O synthase-like polyprenyltransferase